MSSEDSSPERAQKRSIASGEASGGDGVLDLAGDAQKLAARDEEREVRTRRQERRLTRTRISRYLLNALERTARGTKEPEMVPNANEDEVNLEHILPRNAKKADWPAFDLEEIGPWANRFGNHCLLKKSENSKIGNKPWSVKKPILTASSLRLTKRAGKKPDWTKAEIEDRQRFMAARAVKTWPRKPQ
jgi:hypothetical protein